MKKETIIFFKILFSILFFIALAVLIWSSFVFGAEKINFKDGLDAIEKTILYKLRAPRIALSLMAGAMLGGAGAVFQMYFRNPLAESGVLGISSGATLGAVIFSLCMPATFLGLGGVNLGAFTGALVSGILIAIISGLNGGKNSTVAILLCGTALGTFFSAFTSILLTMNGEKLQVLYGWMMGSFSGRGWKEFRFICVPCILAVFFFILTGKDLNLLSGGEEVAQSLGVKTGLLRFNVILSGALATSAAVCAGGTIGFVGLIAPHLVRKIFGSKAQILIPFSMITGAFILLASDLICRTVLRPGELPVGTVTALIGAPFFISLIFTSRKK